MPPSLRDLPKLQDLLQHPTVLQALERVNQSTVAQQATGFLNELRAGATRAVGNVPQSVGDLAEQFVRRVLGGERCSAPVVNATGRVLGGPWDSIPLAESAAHATMVAASDFATGLEPLLASVEQKAAQLAGAEQALACVSMAAVDALARGAGVEFEAAGIAGIVDPAEYGLASVPTVAERLRSGAAAVAVAGDGLLGGPACGLLFGRSNLISELKAATLYAAVKPDRLVLSALEATLVLYDDPEQAAHKVPLLRLLSTPLANLQQRAERLAPQVAAQVEGGSAEAVEEVSAWCQTEALHLEAPTWSVRVGCGSSAAALAERLQQESAVVARWRDDTVLLDLRTVFPRWDQRLVAASAALAHR